MPGLRTSRKGGLSVEDAGDMTQKGKGASGAGFGQTDDVFVGGNSFEAGEPAVEKTQEMVDCITEDGVFAQAREDDRVVLTAVGVAERGDGVAAFSLCEAAPEFRVRIAGRKIVHIDAILRHQGQHILAGLDELTGPMIAQSKTQCGETGLVAFVIGEMESTYDVRGHQGGAVILDLWFEHEGGLVINSILTFRLTPGGGCP